MSKYNLIDIFEGMTDKEFSDSQEKDRLEAHPEKDMIKKIKTPNIPPMKGILRNVMFQLF